MHENPSYNIVAPKISQLFISNISIKHLQKRSKENLLKPPQKYFKKYQQYIKNNLFERSIWMSYHNLQIIWKLNIFHRLFDEMLEKLQIFSGQMRIFIQVYSTRSFLLLFFAIKQIKKSFKSVGLVI